jgi:DNA-binding MarR family transcriptional regulator
VPKANILRKDELDPSGSRDAIVQIQECLQIMSQSMNQVRAHENLLQEAGVRLDKAGVALLFKLHLHEESSLRVTDLAELLGVDPPTVTRKVQQLERLGFVIREADHEDRRATRIQLTAAGRDSLERVLRAHRERLARLFEEWNESDLTAFAAMLERFAGAVRSEMEKNRD